MITNRSDHLPGAPTPRRRARARAWLAGALLLAATLLVSPTARAGDNGIGQVLTAKSLPPATIALIDPESGTSSGGGGTDVRVAVGDIILFRFMYFPTPKDTIRGVAGHLTEYIPANTQVVGVRLIDQNGLTIEPAYPGFAVDGCGGSCGGFTAVPCGTGATPGSCSRGNGSIAQVHGDTGVFFTTDPRLSRDPAAGFIAFTNGRQMIAIPTDVAGQNNIGDVIGAGLTGPYYAHNAWDWVQALAFGTSSATNTPWLYGSPVAGPDSFYYYEATEYSGAARYNDVVGPWQRIVYPGSLKGRGTASFSGNPDYMVEATAAGFDVTPANPLPIGTKAVRFATGDLRVGEPGWAEIALKVLGLPLDPGMGKDVDCAEAMGSGDAAGPGNVKGDNPWSFYLGAPACVYLNLQFDLTVDKTLATTGDTLTYTLRTKNLSLNAQQNVVVRLKYDSTDGNLQSATGTPTTTTCDGLACLQWNLGTVGPSEENTFTIVFVTGGGGHLTNVKTANYQSQGLAAPGFSVRALTVVKPISRAAAALAVPTPYATAGGTASLTGALTNNGSGSGTFAAVTLGLPPGWTLRQAACPSGQQGLFCVAGAPVTCTGTTTNQPRCPVNQTLASPASVTLAFTVNVPAGTAAGLYPVDLQLEGSQSGFGGTFFTYFNDLAFVPVGHRRAAAPTLTCPISWSATSISGTTSEADGTVITLYFNGLARGTAVAAGGQWTSTNFSSFGPLYGGLEVRATAQQPGTLLESPRAAACFVVFGHQCADGIDNDGDGLTDFPADPDCLSPTGDSEGARPPVPPECADGIDNDGDGLTDLADADCRCATGTSERRVPRCADGCDHDGDGRIDFPADPGCHSANDDDEADVTLANDGAPRLLIAVDTSGSMNFNACDDVSTGGDGSGECPGSDVACTVCGGSGCDNGAPDDSRLHKVKAGISDAVRAFGEIDWGLMRFHQRAEAFACVGTNVSLPSGGWQGAFAPADAACPAPFDSGDLLVSFGHDNLLDLLAWMNGSADWPYAGAPPRGLDFELRGTGTTPLAGVLSSAKTYLQAVRVADPQATCRPYRVVLLTDGAENCAGDPVAAAGALHQAGIDVNVIGFALSDPAAVSQLGAIATAGGTGAAIFIDNAAALSTAIGSIVSSSIKVEICNGLDDDCDGVPDEPWPEKFQSCTVGVGVCARAGVYVCQPDGSGTCCGVDDGRGLGVGTCLAPGGPTHTPEVCPPDGLDDDCNGVIDDVPGGCGICTVEVCNGVDDDCDGQTDELNKIFPCPTGAPSPANCQCPAGRACANVDDLPSCWCAPTCGTTVGECRPGVQACVAGVLACGGGVNPAPEQCDGQDNNCDGVIDGFSQACYPDGETGCDPVSGVCQGICRMGSRLCPRLLAPAATNDFGPCGGAMTPQEEICNGLDDDCNGITDDVPGGCDQVCVPTPEVCNGKDDDCNGVVDDNPSGNDDPCVDGFDPAQVGVGICRAGRKQCQNSGFVCVGEIGPQPEICDGVDNDCDGTIDHEAPCPVGYACLEGACQPACTAGEFPCAPDRRCVDPDTHLQCAAAANAGCYCLANPCVAAPCAWDTQTCVVVDDQASCVDRCPPEKCTAPEVCLPASGACVDCYVLGCGAADACIGAPGRCEPNPCAGKECPADTFCQDGACLTLCRDVSCPAGEECVAGACRPSQCGGVACPLGEVCDPATGRCERSRCESSCPRGQACAPATGACVDDPCALTTCPRCSTCAVGWEGASDCVSDPACEGQRVFVTAQGGGCAAAGAGRAAPALTPLLVLLLLGAVARRRGGAVMKHLALMMVLVGAGCSLRSFELRDDHLGDSGLVLGDGGEGDGGPAHGDGGPAHADGGEVGDGGLRSDACAADLATDPANCGECGHICSLPSATPACADGACVLAACLPGFWDLNGAAGDGCEYACTVTSGGVEACDNLDNDCDGETDEDTSKQTDVNNCGGCGYRCILTHAAAECRDGACAVATCDPEWNDANHLALDGCECHVSNGAVEICDGIDNDCNGTVDDVPVSVLRDDPQHCGACDANCTTLPHAAGDCAGDHCVILGCEYGYFDVNGQAADGCEVHCPYGAPGEPEVCDGIDNNCDGVVDADGPGGPLIGQPVPAVFCRQLGACTGAVPVCTAGRWLCDYGPDVELAGPNQVAAQETRCDGKDNDCDGCIDESFPQVGLRPTPNGGTCAASPAQACSDTGIGACQGHGEYACTADDAGVECRITQPGGTPTPEACDGVDNDCDGVVDNAAGPNRVVEPMVPISGGALPGTVYVYTYEASRPDATAAAGGASTARACARPGVVPWTNLTYAQAGAACAAAGKRLCTEAEWQRACETATACAWSFAAACTTSSTATCNTYERDADPAAPGDQDALLPTGALAACYADWGAASRIYDLTGNVKELTQARGANRNPLRGGAYDTILGGSTCGSSFTVVDDTFKYGNTGFRCCADTPP